MASVSELRVYLRLFANDVISPYGAYDVIAATQHIGTLLGTTCCTLFVEKMGRPHDDCWLKFHYFVGCRLKFSTFVGCR